MVAATALLLDGLDRPVVFLLKVVVETAQVGREAFYAEGVAAAPAGHVELWRRIVNGSQYYVYSVFKDQGQAHICGH